MTHDEAFLQAIIDNPDDDAPRLIYADWLEERGDPRGEFIRVQCALAGMAENDARWPGLMAREKALLATYQKAWIGPACEHVHRPVFARGLLDEVLVDGPEFLCHAPELFRSWRLRSAVICLRSEQLSDLLSNPVFLRLREVHLRGQLHQPNGGLRGSDVERIAACPLTKLTSFGLEDNRIGPEGVRRLTEAPWLAILRSLTLRVEDVGASGVESLAYCPALASLTALDFGSNDLTAAAIQALAASRHLTRLERLDLGGNAIDAAAARALAQNGRLGGLKDLGLSFNNLLGDAGLEELAHSRHLNQLRRLRLRETSLRQGAAHALAQSPYLHQLTHLDLNRNHIGSQGAVFMARSAAFSHLTHLDLAGNEIGDDGAKALAASPTLAGLRNLIAAPTACACSASRR